MTLPYLFTFAAPLLGSGSNHVTVVVGAVVPEAVGPGGLELLKVGVVAVLGMLDAPLLDAPLVGTALLDIALVDSGNGATLTPVELAGLTVADETRAGTAGDACPPIDEPHPATISAAAATAPHLRSLMPPSLTTDH